ncbi:hypothetical protein NDU88_002731 [Pleurodeles waltl]|uniref:Uncharacterized protein n=1 Tax=Pleurodeles waltl TaxID=8319 RepID=A0AAV7W382_PLEWA|nr:hypothetical protein NDU88_002731 [Pleurodeles waltl]
MKLLTKRPLLITKTDKRLFANHSWRNGADFKSQEASGAEEQKQGAASSPRSTQKYGKPPAKRDAIVRDFESQEASGAEEQEQGVAFSPRSTQKCGKPPAEWDQPIDRQRLGWAIPLDFYMECESGNTW